MRPDTSTEQQDAVNKVVEATKAMSLNIGMITNAIQQLPSAQGIKVSEEEIAAQAETPATDSQTQNDGARLQVAGNALQAEAARGQQLVAALKSKLGMPVEETKSLENAIVAKFASTYKGNASNGSILTAKSGKLSNDIIIQYCTTELQAAANDIQVANGQCKITLTPNVIEALKTKLAAARNLEV